MTIREVFFAQDRRIRSIWRFVVFVPVFLGFGFVVALAMGFLFGVERLQNSGDLGLLAQGIILLTASVAAGWVLLRLLDRRCFHSLGLWFYRGWGKELGLGVLLGTGLNSVVVFGLWAFGTLRLRPSHVGAGEAIAGLLWALLVVSLPSAAEETLMRGYPFQRLLESWGPLAAVLFTSAFFGWGHLSNPSATALSTLNTGLAGVLLAVMYLKTRALWFPIGLHISWNYVMGAVYSLPVSGLHMERKILEAEVSGPEWLSGGGFGPEGSVLATVVLLVATIWLVRTKTISVSPEQRNALK